MPPTIPAACPITGPPNAVPKPYPSVPPTAPQVVFVLPAPPNAAPKPAPLPAAFARPPIHEPLLLLRYFDSPGICISGPRSAPRIPAPPPDELCDAPPCISCVTLFAASCVVSLVTPVLSATLCIVADWSTPCATAFAMLLCEVGPLRKPSGPS